MRKIFLILVIVLIVVLAFLGVYKKENNVWNNLIPDYKYGMELDGYREFRYVADTSEAEKNVYVDSDGNVLGVVKEEEKVDSDLGDGISLEIEGEEAIPNTNETETISEEIQAMMNELGLKTELRNVKANEDNILTLKNFETSKKIMQKRIETRSEYEYNIRLDSLTGELIIEIPENEEIGLIAEILSAKGKFEVIDEQTGIILMDNSYIKSAKAKYGSNPYQAYLELEFNKEGKEKLRDISNEYIVVTDEEGNETIKYISLSLDGAVMSTTYFGIEIADGILQLRIGNPTYDYEEFRAIVKSLDNIVSIIDLGNMPVKYVMDSTRVVQPNITKSSINIAKALFATLVIISAVVLIVLYRKEGAIGALASIGYIGLFSLVLRYASIYITINSVIAFLTAVSINYVFIVYMLRKMKENKGAKIAYIESMKEIYIKIIPICIIAVVFTFMGNITIASIGMVLFWGVIVHAIYNTITRYVF